ncbi:DUF805 domain-containing protein [Isoptericola chiayiensis]|uniref:DUF805 domain-containing protein n=1 Tax=Isoptericola chiayiensis TaxID=579446 RepID=A0ABP8XWJ6_9MICO|nr:DUF805 domain-containing protein [Isoptericola chiayiensis]NOW02186.1 uncharacterized membrane protein YhaH (DUF805 family) [Isoptericola chiayiensis]
MGFGEAVRTVFGKYATFSGRARRSEYWWWYLFVLLVSIALSILVAVFGGYSIDADTGMPVFEFGSALLIFAAWLLFVIPNIAVTVRRLHDTDRSGFWWFIGFVPLVGWIILLVLMVLEGTQGPNRFGPDPAYRSGLGG